MKSLKSTAICCLLLIIFVLPFESRSIETPEKCAVPTLKVAFDSSTAVFVGKVLSETSDGDVKTFEFQVERYWKGVKSKKIKVSVRETSRYQAWYQVEERYLVYAREDEGKLYDGRCSASKPLEQASVDLKKLGKAKTPR
jgi:hypothetical protein